MKALIVVDVERDFCEGGSLAVDGGAQVAADISQYRSVHLPEYYKVIATKDWHVDPGTHWAPTGEDPDFDATWPKHCAAGEEGSEFHPNLDIQFDINHDIFYKGLHEAAYSGFEGRNQQHETLEYYLRSEGIDEVDVVGIATDYCVKATAIDAALRGFKTKVVLHLTAAVHPGSVEVVVEELVAAGVEVVE